MQNLFVLKVKLEKDFAAAAYFSDAPPLICFCLAGWSSNFVDSESGPIQSVKVMQYTVCTAKTVIRKFKTNIPKN